MIKKGTFVRISGIVMKAADRSPNLPEDTKKEDMIMWNKGFLLADAKMGDEVEITTLVGRKVSGKLVESNHTYEVNYGQIIPELIAVGVDTRKELGNE